MTNFEKVIEFMEAFGQEVLDTPDWVDTETTNLRMALIEEEAAEVLEAMEEGESLADVAKELCDLLYVVYGTAATHGIDIDACFEAVHESNMSKLGPDGKPIYREDGKVMKGPNYFKANLEKCM